MSRDLTYCKQIIDAIDEIENFIQGMTFEQFEQDIKTQRAVTRDLEIIGEVSKRFSKEFQEKHRTVPWRKIGSMRDFLIHDYMMIDVKEVWKAAAEDIRELKRDLPSA